MRMLDEKESELVEEVDGVLVCCCESLLRASLAGSQATVGRAADPTSFFSILEPHRLTLCSRPFSLRSPARPATSASVRTLRPTLASEPATAAVGRGVPKTTRRAHRQSADQPGWPQSSLFARPSSLTTAISHPPRRPLQISLPTDASGRSTSRSMVGRRCLHWFLLA